MSDAGADWPFEDPRNTVALSLARVTPGGGPVLLVVRDADDGGFQFLDGGDCTNEQARVVGLGRMVDADPTLRDLADLPPGWRAWRTGVGGRWTRVRDGGGA